MFSSVILDVAIGMSFIYLILSLMASVIQELLATMVQARAANLQRGLRSLLSGDSIAAGTTLVDDIYTHGLVRGLYQDPWKDYRGKPGRLTQFRLTLQSLLGVSPGVPIAGVSDQLLLPAYIPSRTFALAMIDLLNRNKLNANPPIQNILELLMKIHLAAPENKAVEALLALAVDAAIDPKNAGPKLQANIENWFNDSMDRVSGWYKKYTHNVLLLIGLVIAVAFNVDSIRVAHTLWLDRGAREGMVQAATEYLHENPRPPTPMKEEEAALIAEDSRPVEATNFPAAEVQSGTRKTGKTLRKKQTRESLPSDAEKSKPADAQHSERTEGAASSTVPRPSRAAKRAEVNDPEQVYNDLTKRMTSTANAINDVTRKELLPIGWQGNQANDDFEGTPGTTLPMILRILGWLITAAALSLGASFWFDTLNKFMVVRNTIKPQEKSKDEKSKDS